MKKTVIHFILAMIGVMASGGSATAEAPVVIAINLIPPYVFQKDGTLQGVIPEITQIVADKAGLPYVIEVYPWARIYKMGLEDKNILIPTIYRTPEREKRFKWVGAVFPLKLWIFKLKKRTDIRVDSIEAAKAYQIGGENEDASTQYLIQQGFVLGKNLTAFTRGKQLVQMLNSGRLDLVVAEELNFQHWVETLGLNLSNFEKVYFLNEVPGNLNLAFSLNTHDVVVEKYKKALNEIKEEGTFEKVLRKWGR
ncbi:MAG: transporter substrate-binding domain-containing protein [Rhodocyclaceae bacterium]|nr:transporter substrate-binding domain-containing protein [Rhodocyclaceae bacterium]